MKTINTSVAVCLCTHRKNGWVQAKEFSLLNESFGNPFSLLVLQKVQNYKKWLTEELIQDLRFKKDLFSAQLITINHPLHARDQDRLEKALCCKVMDRTELLLQIFEKRASSATGKLQVALAKIDYELSKLVRFWTHLERQRGGTTFIGGPGELQIELDKRLIQSKIVRIKKRLVKVKARRKIQRKSRLNSNFQTFALVGYTNAGKTKLFNKLTKKKQSSQNKLFETLDTKISKFYLNDHHVGIIDTVGFINNIPTQLIESFHATLEEINSANFIINVVDVNDINAHDKILTTKRILKETGVSEDKISKMINVYNKIDLSNSNYKQTQNRIFISALTGEGIENLKDSIERKLT